MFMVRGELTNVRNLLRIWLNAWAQVSIWSYIVVAILFLGSLSLTVIGILHDGVAMRNHNISDISVPILFALVIVFISMQVVYRSNYAKWSVFPQTNNSRFIAMQLANYVIIICAALSALVVYLSHYGVVSVMAHFREGIYFALDFNVVFIVAGFFVYFAYCSLILAVIELAGTILRKWTYYAVVAFAALFALMIANFMAAVEFLQNALSFLTREPSLALFFLKAAGLWIVITGASFVINHFTVYHRSSRRTTRKTFVVVCAAIIVVILIVIPALVIFFSVSHSSSISSTEVFTEHVDDFFPEAEEIRIDVSHLPRGSNLSVEGDGIFVLPTELGVWHFTSDTPAFLSGTEALENLQGDTIVLRFHAPWFNVNGIDLFAYANPHVTAYLEGSTLFIDYRFDNVDVVFIPVWGIVRQFDLFRSGNVFTEAPFGYSTGGSSSANIYIEIE